MTEITYHQKHGQGRKCVITRRACFSSSHRYWLPELSAKENHDTFGKCALSPGHGHNYELIVSMEGTLNEDGMILNLSEVKHAISEQVTNQIDFRYLNDTWPEFDVSKPEGCLPTTEALVKIIWEKLKPHIPVFSLRLYEHERLWTDYCGNTMETYLTIRKHFAAAHRLAREELSKKENENIYGKCARTNGHGHNYLVDITVKGEINPRTGMICNLSALQDLVEKLVIEPFDHSFLNKDIPYFKKCVPTAENIALYIADKLEAPIKEIGAILHKVRLQESPNNAAEVYPDMNSIESNKKYAEKVIKN